MNDGSAVIGFGATSSAATGSGGASGGGGAANTSGRPRAHLAIPPFMTTPFTAPAPLGILDVQYTDTQALAACVVAASFRSPTPIEERVALVSDVKPYKPGAFFERELPCLLAVLALVQTPLLALVIDGYVDLDEHGAPGLGAHLHAHFQGAIPVVGVAKTAFRKSSFATPVLRGKSQSPLFVTARGLSPDNAAHLVQQMHGPHRIPTLLTRVDHLARGLASPRQAK